MRYVKILFVMLLLNGFVSGQASCFENWNVTTGTYNKFLWNINDTFSKTSVFTANDSTGLKLCLPDIAYASLGVRHNKTIVYGKYLMLAPGFNITFSISVPKTLTGSGSFFGIGFLEDVTPGVVSSWLPNVNLFYLYETGDATWSGSSEMFNASTIIGVIEKGSGGMNQTFTIENDLTNNKFYLHNESGAKEWTEYTYNPTYVENRIMVLLFGKSAYTGLSSTDICINVKDIYAYNNVGNAIQQNYYVYDSVSGMPLNLCEVLYLSPISGQLTSPYHLPESLYTNTAGITTFADVYPGCYLSSDSYGFLAGYNIRITCPSYPNYDKEIVLSSMLDDGGTTAIDMSEATSTTTTSTSTTLPYPTTTTLGGYSMMFCVNATDGDTGNKLSNVDIQFSITGEDTIFSVNKTNSTGIGHLLSYEGGYYDLKASKSGYDSYFLSGIYSTCIRSYIII